MYKRQNQHCPLFEFGDKLGWLCIFGLAAAGFAAVFGWSVFAAYVGVGGIFGFVASRVVRRFDDDFGSKAAKAAEEALKAEEEARERNKRRAARHAADAPRRARSQRYGTLNRRLVCPHCQETGTVRTKTVVRGKGLSGGKATAAVLTGGLSMLATGLSRKEKDTQAHCENCGSTWFF